MVKVDNSHRSKKFSRFSKLFQENCEGFLQDYDAFDKANLEECQVYLDWHKWKHFQLLNELLTSAPVLPLLFGNEGYTMCGNASRVGLGGCADAKWKSDYLCFTTINETHAELSYSWIGDDSCVTYEIYTDHKSLKYIVR